MPSYGSETPDLSPNDIVPVQGLRDSLPDIGNRALIDERYQTEGYLYFRGLLPRAAIDQARREMLAPLIARGLVADDSARPVWIGGEEETPGEEAPEFEGICERLFQAPGVKEAIEKLLGEPASRVPMVQYRTYRPNDRLGRVHQDGFFTPGVPGYKPVWISLVEMDEAMGGLVLGVGMTGKGFFHNTDKKMAYIPKGVVPDEVWARTDYQPGDVVVLHPDTPHVGLPNRSNRVRVSIDTRVQSAANPSIIVGDLVTFNADEITLRTENGSLRTLPLDDDTFIRTGFPLGRRMTRTEFAAEAETGLNVMASLEGERVKMLRRAFAG